MSAVAKTKPKKALISMSRLWTHIALALGTLIGCLLAFRYDPSGIMAEPLSLGFAYVSLVYLVATLLVGPLYLARQKRNPVNLYIRRDIGIWAGVTALLHVFFSFKLYNGGEILLYFFRKAGNIYLPQLDIFGLSNYVGLVATVIITLLLVLSNDWSLKRLKGKLWKRIQQWTYPLIVLTILHTFGYQLYNERDGLLPGTVAALVLITAAGQGVGFFVHRRRDKLRAQAKSAKGGAGVQAPAAQYLTPQKGAPLAEGSLSRRGFLLAGGGALLAGIAILSYKVTDDLFGPASSPFASQPQAGLLPSPVSTSAPTAAVVAEVPAAPTSTAVIDVPPAPASTAVADVPSTPTAEVVADVPATPVPAEPTAVADSALPTATVERPASTPTNPPAPTVARATPTQPPVPTQVVADTGTSDPGLILTTLTDCPVNSAVAFTTPDTDAAGILIHEVDGSVKAFSNVCTHRPYPLEYDASTQLLVCPLHLACFNAATGKVTQGPARRALAPIQVHVDGQGNVVYG